MQGMESVTIGSFNPSIVLMSFVISVFGSWCGLTAASRARRTRGGAHWAWLFGAATSIGGAAIWSMHFIGMLAFESKVQYDLDLPMTFASLVAAIAAAMIGLTIATTLKGIPGYIAGGVVTGLGVVVMHYLGMYAMKMPADMEWRPPVVALSVVIAVVAASLALYFALNVSKVWQHAAAAVLMGVGVCLMHYTGMIALMIKPNDKQMASFAGGADPFSLALPIFAITSVLLIGVVFASLFIENADERAANELAVEMHNVPAQRDGQPLDGGLTGPAPMAAFPGQSQGGMYVGGGRPAMTTQAAQMGQTGQMGQLGQTGQGFGQQAQQPAPGQLPLPGQFPGQQQPQAPGQMPGLPRRR